MIYRERIYGFWQTASVKSRLLFFWHLNSFVWLDACNERDFERKFSARLHGRLKTFFQIEFILQIKWLYC